MVDGEIQIDTGYSKVPTERCPCRLVDSSAFWSKIGTQEGFLNGCPTEVMFSVTSLRCTTSPEKVLTISWLTSCTTHCSCGFRLEKIRSFDALTVRKGARLVNRTCNILN